MKKIHTQGFGLLSLLTLLLAIGGCDPFAESLAGSSWTGEFQVEALVSLTLSFDNNSLGTATMVSSSSASESFTYTWDPQTRTAMIYELFDIGSITLLIADDNASATLNFADFEIDLTVPMTRVE